MTVEKITRSFFIAVFAILAALLIMSCEEDNPVTTNPDAIIGSWTRTVTDAQGLEFDAKLAITNNSYDFIVLTNAPGHSDSYGEYVIENGMIKIIKDDDCFDVIGYYNFSVNGDMLTLSSFEDLCDGRRIALNGSWSKF
jgi:hypothetical protein